MITHSALNLIGSYEYGFWLAGCITIILKQCMKIIYGEGRYYHVNKITIILILIGLTNKHSYYIYGVEVGITKND
jgi:hypothetical protein